MNLEIEAVYEDGVLKPRHQLPLQKGQRVKLTIHNPGGRAKASAGMFHWQGRHEELDKLLGPDNHPWNDGRMTFADIPSGAAVFVDANIFVYHFIAHPQYGASCTDLLDRIENQHFEGVTSSHILGELAHRLMTLEAQQRFSWAASGLANRLKRHPAEVRQLTWHKRGIDEVHVIGFRLLPVEAADISQAVDASSQYGLLSNDGLVVTLMRRHGFIHLASLDADFDRVPGINRYTPM